MCTMHFYLQVINDGHGGGSGKLQTRPSAMELVTPADGRRTLWCELPEVIDSGLLSKCASRTSVHVFVEESGAWDSCLCLRRSLSILPV